MATVGTFDLNLDNIKDITNESQHVAEKVTEEVADMSDIIGIGIALFIAIGLITVALVALIALPLVLIKKLKGYKKG